MEDSQYQITNFYESQNCDNSYLRFKSAWKLNSRQLGVLQALCRWREDQAQDKNLPRNRIIKEPALMEIVQKNITDTGRLRQVEGVSERMVREFGGNIIEIVNKAKKLEDDLLPPRLPKPLNASERVHLQELKDYVATVAEQLQVPVEILVRKKEYEQLINSHKRGQLVPPATFSGWRKDVVADTLITMVQGSEKNDHADLS